MGWYVLKYKDKYIGQHWDVVNQLLRNPRMTLVPLKTGQQDCVSLVWSLEAVGPEVRRVKGILGIDVAPVAVSIEGRGEHARIVEATK